MPCGSHRRVHRSTASSHTVPQQHAGSPATVLHTVGAETPETIGPLVGDYGWYQYYPTKEVEVRDDILRRGKDP